MFKMKLFGRITSFLGKLPRYTYISLKQLPLEQWIDTVMDYCYGLNHTSFFSFWVFIKNCIVHDKPVQKSNNAWPIESVKEMQVLVKLSDCSTNTDLFCREYTLIVNMKHGYCVENTQYCISCVFFT